MRSCFAVAAWLEAAAWEAALRPTEGSLVAPSAASTAVVNVRRSTDLSTGASLSER
jgi:hypothetical protein